MSELKREYAQWRHEQELEYLNAYGAAGFELVAYHVDTTRGVYVRAAFKRPVGAADAADAIGQSVGFRPIVDQNE